MINYGVKGAKGDIGDPPGPHGYKEWLKFYGLKKFIKYFIIEKFKKK